MLTVSQLNSYVGFKFKSDVKLKGIAIKGEISNLVRNHSSGHIYFTLKDDASCLKAVMFSSSASRLKVQLENNMIVIALGNIECYEKGGVYQIICTDVQPLGLGMMYIQTQLLKEKLEKLGIFDEEIKKEIPVSPQKISVVTSITGAALQDILNIIARRYPCVSMLIVPALVQGENAPSVIAQAIDRADNSGSDIIILARGGGSFEDLMPFNSEAVTMAVYHAQTPIISAVGHETDTSLCDYAADLRAPTPSAAAELAVPDISELYRKLNSLSDSLYNTELIKLNSLMHDYKAEQFKLESLAPLAKLNENKAEINRLSDKLHNIQQNRVDALRQKLMLSISLLGERNPLNVMSRGFSCVTRNNSVITNASQLNVKDVIEIRFHNSSAIAEIVETSFEENNINE